MSWHNSDKKIYVRHFVYTTLDGCTKDEIVKNAGKSNSFAKTLEIPIFKSQYPITDWGTTELPTKPNYKIRYYEYQKRERKEKYVPELEMIRVDDYIYYKETL